MKPRSQLLHTIVSNALKSKEPRLRDWNSKSSYDMSSMIFGTWNQKNLDYEIETQVNLDLKCGFHFTWNQKNLDYEIETKRHVEQKRVVSLAWNQKNLDYEIETPTSDPFQCHVPGLAWNQKNLDYEIETLRCSSLIIFWGIGLKSKEPRLRDWNSNKRSVSMPRSRINLKSKEPRLRDWNSLSWSSPNMPKYKTWNQKNLDYEIETSRILHCQAFLCGAWNQKNLDYEIETSSIGKLIVHVIKLEIKRTSITRLKLVCKDNLKISYVSLKSKEPRLRDWNMFDAPGAWGRLGKLEIKRTSITRLKLDRNIISRRIFC